MCRAFRHHLGFTQVVGARDCSSAASVGGISGILPFPAIDCPRFTLNGGIMILAKIVAMLAGVNVAGVRCVLAGVICLTNLWLILGQPANAQTVGNAVELVVFNDTMKIGPRTEVRFGSVSTGRKILMEKDDFVRRMSPFDRSARLKTDQDVSTDDYLEFVGQAVLEWEPADREAIRQVIAESRNLFAEWDFALPPEIVLIKTTGDEEGGAPYTRSSAIVFPEAVLSGSDAQLRKIFFHELFHLLSRFNSRLRDELYRAIGFERCGEFTLPETLQSRKITNPDAPKNEHCIQLKVDGQDQWAIPILFSRSPKYSVDQGGEFFSYLQFELMLVDRPVDGGKVLPLLIDGQTKTVVPGTSESFFRQVGRNTRYLIHPEEILADNFALLLMGNEDLPSPKIQARMRRILNRKQDAR